MTLGLEIETNMRTRIAELERGNPRVDRAALAVREPRWMRYFPIWAAVWNP
jgi:hypothetical protein